MDVMIAGRGGEQYQIYQGKMGLYSRSATLIYYLMGVGGLILFSGNFTRFINHSCRPNCQFQTFYWLGIKRIIAVSRGVSAGNELTVDYSANYWEKLDKACLCGESCCRYSPRCTGGGS